MVELEITMEQIVAELARLQIAARGPDMTLYSGPWGKQRGSAMHMLATGYVSKASKCLSKPGFLYLCLVPDTPLSA